MNNCGDIFLTGRKPDAGLLKLISALSEARRRRDAFEAFGRFVAHLGLADAMLTIESGALQKQESISWSTLDPRRAERLTEIGFDGHDPIHRFARRCVDPFAWTRTDWPGERSPASGRMMTALETADIEAGISVAVWGRGGRVAIANVFGTPEEIRGIGLAARETLFVAVAFTFRAIERVSLVRGQPVLTRREFEILELATQGLTSTAIAQRLQIVEHTVKFHFTGIRKKLNVRNRSEAIARFSELSATAFRVSPSRDERAASLQR